MKIIKQYILFAIIPIMLTTCMLWGDYESILEQLRKENEKKDSKNPVITSVTVDKPGNHGEVFGNVPGTLNFTISAISLENVFPIAYPGSNIVFKLIKDDVEVDLPTDIGLTVKPFEITASNTPALFSIDVDVVYGQTFSLRVYVYMQMFNDFDLVVTPSQLDAFGDAVHIRGNFHEDGKTVTADTDELPGNSQLHYQWERADDFAFTTPQIITGATGPSYVLQITDIHKFIRVVVEREGFAGFVESDPIGPINSSEDPDFGAVISLTGTQEIGQTLGVSIINLPTGMTSSGFSYQWEHKLEDQADDQFAAISNATINAYAITSGDKGYVIRLRISHENFKDGFSNHTIVIPPHFTGSVSITGTANVAWTLTAVPVISTLPATAEPLTPVFQWERSNGANYYEIAGTNEATYTLQAVDLGQTVRVVITLPGHSGSATSATTAVIQPQPTLTGGTITIYGMPSVGHTLTVDVTALPVTTNLSFQWERSNASNFDPIPNATNTTYTLQIADEGHVIRVVVTHPLFTGQAISFPTATVEVDRTILGQLNALRNMSPVPETHTLTVYNAETLNPQALTFASAITITLTGETLTLGETNGAMFTINTNVNLILQDIELVGRSNNNNALVVVNGGTLTMNAGSRIRGNTNSSASTATTLGGGVRVIGANSKLNMNIGAEISGNSAANGAGVEVNNRGIFEMFGGTITDNSTSAGTGTRSGGGVRLHATTIDNRVNFIMRGGTISNNTASTGGGVSLNQNGTFDMFGGLISNNSTTGNGFGGGVRVAGATNSLSIFNMYDGTISGNRAGVNSLTGGSSEGGGVMNDNNGRFRMYGGTIHGNEATWGGGISNLNNGWFTMSGGVISGNTALQGGGIINDYSVTLIQTGIIYGEDAEVNLRNSGLAPAGYPKGSAIFNVRGSLMIYYLDAEHNFPEDAFGWHLPSISNLTVDILNAGIRTETGEGNPGIMVLNIIDIPEKYTGHALSLYAIVDGLGSVPLFALHIEDASKIFLPYVSGNWSFELDIHTLINQDTLGPVVSTYIFNKNLVRGNNFSSFAEFENIYLTVETVTITDIPEKYLGKAVELCLSDSRGLFLFGINNEVTGGSVTFYNLFNQLFVGDTWDLVLRFFETPSYNPTDELISIYLAEDVELNAVDFIMLYNDWDLLMGPSGRMQMLNKTSPSQFMVSPQTKMPSHNRTLQSNQQMQLLQPQWQRLR